MTRATATVPGPTTPPEAAAGRAAVAAAASHRADVALVDIKMPVLDGLTALAELRRLVPSLPVVVLTSFGTEPNTLQAIQRSAPGSSSRAARPMS